MGQDWGRVRQIPGWIAGQSLTGESGGSGAVVRQPDGSLSRQIPGVRAAVWRWVATWPMAGYNKGVYTLQRWSRSSAAAS